MQGQEISPVLVPITQIAATAAAMKMARVIPTPVPTERPSKSVGMITESGTGMRDVLGLAVMEAVGVALGIEDGLGAADGQKNLLIVCRFPVRAHAYPVVPPFAVDILPGTTVAEMREYRS
jgi:hypothetical protein